MAWIESHQALKDHPKVLAMCELLGAERPHVVGYLHLMWWWCIDYAPDGDVTKYSAKQIARASEWSGDYEKYYSALIKSGFIEKSKNSIKIHDWIHYCGALMERRLQRMAAKRTPTAAERPPTNQTNQTLPTKPRKERTMCKPKVTFVKPTPEEVTAYAGSIGFALEGALFCAHYESNGWRVGRNLMKSWRSAVVTWKHREYRTEGKNAPNGSAGVPLTPLERTRAREAEEIRKREIATKPVPTGV